jgi:hypothetical protein
LPSDSDPLQFQRGASSDETLSFRHLCEVWKMKKWDRLLCRDRFSRAATRAKRGYQAEQGGDASLPSSRAERLLAIDAGAKHGEFVVGQREVKPGYGWAGLASRASCRTR